MKKEKGEISKSTKSVSSILNDKENCNSFDLNSRNARFEDDFRGMVRHLNSAKHKERINSSSRENNIKLLQLNNQHSIPLSN